MTSRRSVRETYDRIASHFAKTRAHPWDEVTDFLSGRAGTVGLDLGCGNGRHISALADRTDAVLALDSSWACLCETSRRTSDLDDVWIVQGDAAALPFTTDLVDVAVYVATIHHLPTRSLRLESLNELARVLTSDGRALVSAWCVSHDRFEASVAFDTTVDWTLPDGERVPRYYHVYDLDSFESDVADSRLTQKEVFESAGNCYAVVGGA